MASTEADVCVIGGGPAGSSFALRLAQLGHDVVLVERDVFPRLHVGEAFAAGIQVPLSMLRVGQDVRRAGVIETQGTIRLWADGEVERVAPATGHPGLAVDRGVFDQLLLDRARACGVRVLQPASVIGVERTGESWQIAVRGPGPIDQVSARFLADASGRAGVLRPSPRSLLDAARSDPEFVEGSGRPEPVEGRTAGDAATFSVTSPPTIAFAGYWRLSDKQDAMTRLEAAPDRWFWGTPLPGNRFVGMVFCSAGARRSTPREAEYVDLVRRSALLTEALSGASIERVVVRDATCCAAAEPIGATWIRLGEASFSIDPLSSSGVQKALQTSLTGAIVVHTQLTCADRAEAAMTFYRDDQRFGVAQHARWAAAAYSQVQRFGDRPFWRRRAAGALSGPEPWPTPATIVERRVRVAPDTRLVPVPCIVGNLIDVRMAVAHPRLDRPVAFLDDVAVAPLVESIREVATGLELAAGWAPLVPIATGRAVARWLIERGILVDA